jgi:SAM-dependent methyltransferase
VRTDLQPALADVRTSVLDHSHLVRAVASGRRPGQAARWRRAELRPVDLKAGSHLQVTTFDAQQAFTTNHPWSDAAAGVDALLQEPFTSWVVELTDRTVRLQVTRKGDAIISSSPAQRTRPERAAHDRAKRRLVDERAPYLNLLGITTNEGAVKPSRRDKFHQVEEFLRVLEPVVRDAIADRRLPSERPLRVVDLGCGNAYLTFAAYAQLTDGMDVPVELIGVDQKAQALERNTAIARALGWQDHLSFVRAEIAAAAVSVPVDIVLALHACDTATDDALARAVAWQAPIILAAPCCHHDLQRQLKSRPTPPPYAPITTHPILRERFADVLTDALRAAILRQHGYRADVIEFVDTAHTPRNALIRAVRTGTDARAQTLRDYEQLTAQWQVRPRLAELLRGPAGSA